MEKQTAFNTDWLSSVILELVVMVPVLILELIIHINYGWFVIALVLLYSVNLFTTPYKYTFDYDGVTLHYLTGGKQTFLWRNINSLIFREVRRRRSTYYVYDITGTPEGSGAEYMIPHIVKSNKTEELLYTYAGNKVVNFISVPKYKRHKDDFAEYIKRLESFYKTNIENYCSNYNLTLNSLGLIFKQNFVYFSPEMIKKASSTKPTGSFIYSTIIEISRPNETDKERIYEFRIDLVEYNALEKSVIELSVLNSLSIINNAVEEMKRKGFEEYMKIDTVSE